LIDFSNETISTLIPYIDMRVLDPFYYVFCVVMYLYYVLEF